LVWGWFGFGFFWVCFLLFASSLRFLDFFDSRTKLFHPKPFLLLSRNSKNPFPGLSMNDFFPSLRSLPPFFAPLKPLCKIGSHFSLFLGAVVFPSCRKNDYRPDSPGQKKKRRPSSLLGELPPAADESVQCPPRLVLTELDPLAHHMSLANNFPPSSQLKFLRELPERFRERDLFPPCIPFFGGLRLSPSFSTFPSSFIGTPKESAFFLSAFFLICLGTCAIALRFSVST